MASRANKPANKPSPFQPGAGQVEIKCALVDKWRGSGAFSGLMWLGSSKIGGDLGIDLHAITRIFQPHLMTLEGVIYMICIYIYVYICICICIYI